MYIHRVTGVGQVAYTDKMHALESHYQCQRIVSEWWEREVTNAGKQGNQQDNGKGIARRGHRTTSKRNRSRA